MVKLLCRVVEYVYKRKPSPGSKIWHMQSEVDKEESPSELEVGDSKINAGDDTVRVLLAVPCDESGKFSEETINRYEEIADKKFLQVRPDAELA